MFIDLPKVASDSVEANPVYIGSENIEGSYRLYVVLGSLFIQKLEGGIWINKDRIGE